MIFELIDVATDKVLDIVTYDSDSEDVFYSTGRAQSIVEARARRDAVSIPVAAQRLAQGWTNGYRLTQSAWRIDG